MDPEQLGGFEIKDLVGEGGMGMVYRARDQRLDRDVAVKVLHPALVASAEGRARFRAEAKAVGRLAHPNIVQVFHWSEEQDDRQFLVMEFLEGETLRELMDRTHFSPPESLLSVAIPLTKALLHAHSHSVVHRDIKPGNVMVGKDGAVKLMDFGIARLDDSHGLTITGALVGSPAHMAPEVINGLRADERSDQFSLGTVLYEMVTGTNPFDAPNAAAIFRKVDKGEFVPLSRAAPSLNSSLAEAIEQLMERQPADRYDGLQQFLDRMELVTIPWLGNLQRSAQQLVQSPQVTTAAWRDQQVLRLKEATEDAMRNRQWPEAVALANRVVALDPDQSELLRQVSGAANRPWLRPLVVVGLALTLLATAGSQWMLDRMTQANVTAAPPESESRNPNFRQRTITAPEKIAAPSGETAEVEPKQGVILHNLSIEVFPWAEVWINQKRVSAGSRRHLLRLPRGEHHLELRHDLAAPVKRVVRLPGGGLGGGQVLTTKIRRFRPARLSVACDSKATLTTLGQRFSLLKGNNEVKIQLSDGSFRESASLVYEGNDCRRRFDLQFEAGGLHHWQVDCSSP
ncbi:MAG: serine/threonine-protein kinase [Myxococcota bacterium]|nr:serine/threonine-protein kinase [Myxococcota bacterium]